LVSRPPWNQTVRQQSGPAPFSRRPGPWNPPSEDSPLDQSKNDDNPVHGHRSTSAMAKNDPDAYRAAMSGYPDSWQPSKPSAVLSVNAEALEEYEMINARLVGFLVALQLEIATVSGPNVAGMVSDKLQRKIAEVDQ